jgi:2,3-bisphosphoglycerate-dependent phosphoglycerate mutase
MSLLILLRHGQSAWNKKNIFTGWVDIPLSQEGIVEAYEAGRIIKNIPIDKIFISTLVRSSMTAMIALLDHSSGKVPAICHESDAYALPKSADIIPTMVSEALNERHYGALQGKNKEAVREAFGEAQFKLWRRSYQVAPPEGESLKMTAERTLPFFNQVIRPLLEKGETVLVSAHGNSLRSIVMDLESLSEEEVVALEIPTGQPLFYTCQSGVISRDLSR